MVSKEIQSIIRLQIIIQNSLKLYRYIFVKFILCLHCAIIATKMIKRVLGREDDNDDGIENNTLSH